MESFADDLPSGVLREQMGNACDRFTAAEQSRFVALLQSIGRPEDVAIHVEATSHNQWKTTICTSDGVGALSIIAGLFTAYGLDVSSADIFTLRFPQRRPELPRVRSRRFHRLSPVEPQAPAQRLLDIFHIRALVEPAPDVWQSFRDDLAALVSLRVAGEHKNAQEAIIDRVSEAFRAASNAETKLLPMSVDLANEPSSPYTKLTVRSADTPGFLFAFTNALAGLAVNIERAEIQTLDGEALDTFWVTDVGGRQIVDEARSHELRVATTLVKQFTHLLSRSADPGQALRQFNDLVSQMLSHPEWTSELGNLESLSVLGTLADLMGVSRFLWEDFLRMQHGNLFPVLVDVPALDELRPKERLSDDLRRRLQGLETRAERVEELNAFKDREMFRIDLRHITGRSEFTGFSVELTQLAEVTVEMAAELAMEMVSQQYGAPTLADGRKCPWCVCALGKFGGRDLGVGSDLELIFVYEGEGSTNGQASIVNSELFVRFVQAFKGILRARQEGIFEVDLRLRPYGSAGSLACILDGFAQYYSEAGDAEQFERMALVRLRPVAGDVRLGARVLELRDAFVYSAKPLDLENILHFRQRQATELVPRDQVSAKYSTGGLIDIEYFVQARQIVAGHTDLRARTTNTSDGIARLVEVGDISPELAGRLQESYLFLRRLIDALRVVRGHAKDLTIPPRQSREFAYLAHRLRYASPGELEGALTAHMDFARSLWGLVTF